MPAIPGGALRATSARYTPFQPTAEAPNMAPRTTTAAYGQERERRQVPAADTDMTRPSVPSIRRGMISRSAIPPQTMRPATPAPRATVSVSPARTSGTPRLVVRKETR